MRSLVFSALLIFGLVGPLFGTIWYTFKLEQRVVESAFQFEMRQLSHSLSQGMADPIWNLFPESGKALVEAIANDPRVLEIEVTSTDQGRFLYAGSPPPTEQVTETFTLPVQYEGKVIGEVRVVFDAGFNDAALVDNRRQIIIAAGIALALALLIVATVIRLHLRLARSLAIEATNARLEAEVAERKRANAALLASEEMLRLTADSLPALVAYIDADKRIRFLNRTGGLWFDIPSHEAAGKMLGEVIDADLHQEMARHSDAAALGEAVRFEAEQQLSRERIRPLEMTIVPHQAIGDMRYGFFVLAVDLSEMKLAEAQVQQMQKMEIVGRLTGGVAHDFNNLLAVILNSAELLRDAPEKSDELIAGIIRAATRGGELTHRLLSFSRRQTLRPSGIELESLLAGFTDMAARVLSEKIEIKTDMARNTAGIWADSGQLEIALLNLAVNARDAMPDGGVLTIACREASENMDGDVLAVVELAAAGFVVISVTDTGAGMTPETRANAFEPFFTTKEVGQGSGLGLAMVYGFVKQSGGHVTIDSAVNQGTTVKLFLPRAEAMPGKHGPAAQEKIHSIAKDQRVVLLVEDQPDVAEVTAKLLAHSGYRVLQAGTVAAAKRLLRENTQIDVLLSDVVLPGGENGPAMIDEARRLHGQIAIVFMSGYAPPWIAGTEDDNSDIIVLQKPVRRHVLATAIERAIGGSTRSVASAGE